jgi:hypothetical protein
MANPSNQLNQKDISRNINPVIDKDHVRDAANKLGGELEGKVDDFSSQSRQILSDVRERAADLYEISSDWVQENRLITTLSLAAVAGVIGFFLGHSRKEM